ncbi:mitochondrial ubiquitin ligase activator of NFKB 1-like [Mantella aurantiaca]
MERPSLGQIILLASSSAITAIFYTVYRQKYRAAQTLKGAKKISLDEDLQNLLMDLPGKCVPYAVIEGAVRAAKDSLSSQFMENCKGVISHMRRGRVNEGGGAKPHNEQGGARVSEEEAGRCEEDRY